MSSPPPGDGARPSVRFAPIADSRLLAGFSPSLYSLAAYLQFWPYIEAAIPSRLRLYLADRLPHKGFQQVRRVVNTIHDQAVHIYNTKKAALAKGDEGAKELFREGKDLMSIMCTCSKTPRGGRVLSLR